MGTGIFVAGIEGRPRWDGFRKWRDADGPRVAIPYMVAFGQADQFADACLGGVVRTGGKGGTVRYVPPQQCPTNTSLYPISAAFAYKGETAVGAGGVPQFQQCEVTITYGLQPWPGLPSDDPNGDQSFTGADTGQPILFAECEMDYGQEIHQVGEGSAKWQSDNKPMVRPRNRYTGVSNFRIIRHFFPILPYKQVMNLVNKINTATMFGQGRGQVMFKGGRTTAVMTSDGSRIQRFEQDYAVREYDWNKFPREDSLLWDYLVDGGGNMCYFYADLTPLIQ